MNKAKRKELERFSNNINYTENKLNKYLDMFINELKGLIINKSIGQINELIKDYYCLEVKRHKTNTIRQYEVCFFTLKNKENDISFFCTLNFNELNNIESISNYIIEGIYEHNYKEYYNQNEGKYIFNDNTKTLNQWVLKFSHYNCIDDCKIENIIDDNLRNTVKILEHIEYHMLNKAIPKQTKTIKKLKI
jgi:hypothetical protein